MKKIVIVCAALLALSQAAYAMDAEKTAKTLLDAYKARDVETVKANVSGIVANAVSPKYFEEGSIKKYIKDLKNWDGKIREIRYAKSPFGSMAAVHYDDSSRKGRLRAIVLTKMKEGRWVQFANGFEEMKVKEFQNDYSAELTEGGEEESGLKGALGKLGLFGKKSSKGKSGKAAGGAHKGYSFETADGGTGDAPTSAQLEKAFKGLSEDNFFLTLNGPDGFMQGSWMEKGLDMQYKDENGQFNCKNAVPNDEALKMFTGYLEGGDAWKTACEWAPME